MAHLAISCFGTFDVRLDDQPLTAFESNKARALLVYLAVEADRPHQRSKLASLLWPEWSETEARGHLRHVLSHTRKLLCDQQRKPPFLRVDRNTLQFNRQSSHQFDVTDFSQLIADGAVDRPTPASIAHLQEAVTLYRGPFLDGFSLHDCTAFEEWLLLTRDRLHQQLIEALDHLIAFYEQQGEFPFALPYARQQVEHAPWREEAHRQLMQLLARTGQRGAALAQYEKCCQILQTELDVAPDPATVALHQQIQRGEVSPVQVASAQALPPAPLLRSEEQLACNLPIPLTPFVGRQKELDHLLCRLDDPTCRLLTLVGLGGFGKTRLAIQLGEIILAQKRFPDGVFFVPMEGLDNASLVVPAIAAVLSFTFQGQKDQTSQLLSYLAGKHLLLILDNAERRLDSALVENMLVHVPQLKIIVTSREALNLQQEWFHPIEGLDVGNEQADSQREILADALQLFWQSARRIRKDFDLENELPYMQQICALVGGVPLAIELAASWLKALTCRQIAVEIEDNLGFLSSTLRNLPTRHRSMRFVLEQTWSFLSKEEQRVARQISVFTGGCRLDEVKEVIGESLPTLLSLIEKSVLRLAQNGQYRTHPLLQQLGEEKLAEHPQEQTFVQERHCNVYLRFLQQRCESIAGPDQKQIISEVEAELDNIRIAWAYGVRHNRLGDLEKALPALLRLLWTRGRYMEGEWFVTQVLDSVDMATLLDNQWSPYCTLTAHSAHFAAATGAYSRALALLEDIPPAAERCSNRSSQALRFYVAGMIAHYRGGSDDAIGNLKSAYEIYSRLDDAAGIAETALRLGYALIFDIAEAQRLVEEGLQLFRKLGDIANIADALDVLAIMLWASGDFDEAEKCYKESLVLAEEVGHRQVVLRSIGGLGLVACVRDQRDLAIQLLQDRLAKSQELGYENDLYISLNLLCFAYVYAKQYAQAKLLLDEYPEMWRNFWTAQAHIGVGEYAAAMRYLPQGTALKLSEGNTAELSSYLVAWAMLLTSHCILSKDHGTSRGIAPLVPEERLRKAIEILSFIRFYDHCAAETRMQAETLLADLQRQNLVWEYDVAPARQEVHAIEELAQEMLAIRLGNNA